MNTDMENGKRTKNSPQQLGKIKKSYLKIKFILDFKLRCIYNIGIKINNK